MSVTLYRAGMQAQCDWRKEHPETPNTREPAAALQIRNQQTEIKADTENGVEIRARRNESTRLQYLPAQSRHCLTLRRCSRNQDFQRSVQRHLDDASSVSPSR